MATKKKYLYRWVGIVPSLDTPPLLDGNGAVIRDSVPKTWLSAGGGVVFGTVGMRDDQPYAWVFNRPLPPLRRRSQED